MNPLNPERGRRSPWLCTADQAATEATRAHTAPGGCPYCPPNPRTHTDLDQETPTWTTP